MRWVVCIAAAGGVALEMPNSASAGRVTRPLRIVYLFGDANLFGIGPCHCVCPSWFSSH